MKSGGSQTHRLIRSTSQQLLEPMKKEYVVKTMKRVTSIKNIECLDGTKEMIDHFSNYIPETSSNMSNYDLFDETYEDILM